MPKRSKVVPKISDAEWVVMQVLWQKDAATANEVVAALEKSTDWKPKTIHTLLRRLVHKRALEFERRGREHLFKPLVSATECERAATRSFLSRFFGDELAPFLARFVEHEKLKPAEIEELKKILEGKRN